MVALGPASRARVPGSVAMGDTVGEMSVGSYGGRLEGCVGFETEDEAIE